MFTLSGILICFKDEQSAKAYFPISLIDSGKIILSNEVQL